MKIIILFLLLLNALGCTTLDLSQYKIIEKQNCPKVPEEWIGKAFPICQKYFIFEKYAGSVPVN